MLDFAQASETIRSFAANVPVTIVDGSNTEAVTPSAVANPSVAAPSSLEAYSFSITATYSDAYGIGVQVISGAAGLAEAADDNGKAYGITAGAIPLAEACTGTATSSKCCPRRVPLAASRHRAGDLRFAQQRRS